jgi:hypothetical protein
MKAMMQVHQFLEVLMKNHPTALVPLLLLLPISASSEEFGYPQQTIVGASMCSEYFWVEAEYQEFQRVCLSARSFSGNEFSVQYWRECLIGDEDDTCPDSPFENKRTWCSIDSRPWGDVVKALNKNRVEMEIPSTMECDFTIGEPQGMTIVATMNGNHEVKYEVERWESRYQEGDQHCWSVVEGGTMEERSADIAANIDGWSIFSGDYIWNWHGERFANHCSH